MTAVAGETTDISYAVRLQKGRSTVRIVLAAQGDQAEQQIPMTNLQWDGTNLDFAWTTTDGASLNCQMVRQSDTPLSGSCWGGDGQPALDMTMTPPPGRLERL